jgi:hypothetical protein
VNKIVKPNIVTLKISFINIEKSSGDITDPCGSSDFIEANFDVFEL